MRVKKNTSCSMNSFHQYLINVNIVDNSIWQINLKKKQIIQHHKISCKTCSAFGRQTVTTGIDAAVERVLRFQNCNSNSQNRNKQIISINKKHRWEKKSLMCLCFRGKYLLLHNFISSNKFRYIFYYINKLFH